MDRYTIGGMGHKAMDEEEKGLKARIMKARMGISRVKTLFKLGHTLRGGNESLQEIGGQLDKLAVSEMKKLGLLYSDFNHEVLTDTPTQDELAGLM